LHNCEILVSLAQLFREPIGKIKGTLSFDGEKRQHKPSLLFGIWSRMCDGEEGVFTEVIM